MLTTHQAERRSHVFVDMYFRDFRFHSGEFEECRLVGYKIPAHTSQGTPYFSATELRRLMLCKI
jgi:hypothetical protein